MLEWEKCIKKGLIRRTAINRGLIVSLIKTAKEGLGFFSGAAVKDETAGILFKNYYDLLREICEAVALSKGYKIYQHEAITSFLREVLREDTIASKFDRFRQLRNGIHYYGRAIPKEETERSIVDIKKIMETLKSKYLSEWQ